MKGRKNTITLFLLVLVLASCGGDSGPSDTDPVKGILKGTWRVQAVSVDNTDQTMLYNKLTLTFTDANYTTTNGANVWPASGGWTFTDATAKTILRSDGVIMVVNVATETELVLSFHWDNTTIGSGRAKSIEGPHVFTFGE